MCRRLGRFVASALLFAAVVGSARDAYAQLPSYVMSIEVPGPGNGELAYPCDVAVDVTGNLFVADSRACRIQKFGPTGSLMLAFGSKGVADGQFTAMMGIVVDRDGFIHASDVYSSAGAGRVEKFTPSGQFSSQWPAPGVPGPIALAQGLALGPDGDIYVADQGLKCVHRFTASGVYVQQFGGPADLEDPIGVGVDRDGNVYVADFGPDRIVKFAPSGERLLHWQLEDDGSGLRRGPTDVAVDPLGRVYVVAAERSGVLMYDRAGNFLGQWGGAGSEPGKFSHPIGLCVGAEGTLYVADSGNQRIQVYSALPVPALKTSWSRVKQLFR